MLFLLKYCLCLMFALSGWNSLNSNTIVDQLLLYSLPSKIMLCPQKKLVAYEFLSCACSCSGQNGRHSDAATRKLSFGPCLELLQES